MIHLLMEARKGKLRYEEDKLPKDGFSVVEESEVGRNSTYYKKIITDEDITGEGLAFLFAGIETSPNTISLIAYELVINKDVQEKLIREIDEVLRRTDNKLTYDVVMEMKYLDLVVTGKFNQRG